MVRTLAKIDGQQATQALARRAVFDLSPAVRETAVEALKARKLPEAREVFLAALRHPWPSAADHAAHALVALEDRESIPRLRQLEEMLEPSAPVRNKEGKWVSKQLVRFNHLRNCLLCHAPSIDGSGSLRAPVPKPGEPLPVVYYREDSNFQMIRADIVYFRQDFSATHWVPDSKKWPEIQRFDYLVQERELTAAELETRKAAAKKSYPQRDAVRWALAALQQDDRDKPKD
jgi:hypothetical protein